MEDLSEEELIDLEEKIVLGWIRRDFNKLKSRKSIKKRKKRVNKRNYWETDWGQLILSDGVKDPSSYEGKFFKRRFRVPFGLFEEVLIPMCKEKTYLRRRTNFVYEYHWNSKFLCVCVY